MYNILVVDDEVKIRSIVRKYAEFEGHSVAEAADGMSAVCLCRENSFDIVIMDIMMPELDGFSACREIRKITQTPIIMLSARGEEYDKINGFEYSRSQEMNLQQALDFAFTIFYRDYENERAFWDLNQNVDWQFEDATEKQIALIKSKISPIDFEQLTLSGRLTKSGASQVINMLNIQNLKLSDLMRMHEKSVKEQEKIQSQKEIYSKLKIRYVLDKKKRFCINLSKGIVKFYFI